VPASTRFDSPDRRGVADARSVRRQSGFDEDDIAAHELGPNGVRATRVAIEPRRFHARGLGDTALVVDFAANEKVALSLASQCL
jgi:hypothetical protein